RRRGRFLAVVADGLGRGARLEPVDERAHRHLAIAELVEHQVASDGEQIALVRMETVVADARRLLEGAHERLLQRVVEIERLRVAGEAQRAPSGRKCESALQERSDLGRIVAIDLLEGSSLSTLESIEQLSPLNEERHPLSFEYSPTRPKC